MDGIKGHILIVDDNEFNREVLLQNLEDLGFSCEAASDGQEALAMLDSRLPDMLLLDVMMPGIDGYEVCRILRSQERTSQLPVMMVTAKADSAEIVEGLRAGANDYVTKPIDMDVLLARVETHLHLQRLREQARETSDRLINDMRAAREVQQTMLPDAEALEQLPGAYGLRIAPVWKPKATLATDFWDMISLADGSLGLSMVDFGGTGVVPALKMFQFHSFFHAQCTGLYNAGLTMARINSYLNKSLNEFELAYGSYTRFDPDTLQFFHCAGGTPPPLVYRAENRAVERVRVRGLPLGPFLDAVHEERRVSMKPGDRIVFATDGMFHAYSEERDYFSEKQLATILVRGAKNNLEDVAARLEAEIDDHVGEGRLRDDVTILMAELANE